MVTMNDRIKIAKELLRIAKSLVAKWNDDGYRFYVVLDGESKIESGWEYREDAKDRLDEMMEDGVKGKIFARRALLAMGMNPDDDSNWHTGELARTAKKRVASGYQGDFKVEFKWDGKTAHAEGEYTTNSDKKVDWIEYKATLPDGRVVEVKDNELFGNYGYYKEKKLTDKIIDAIYWSDQDFFSEVLWG